MALEERVGNLEIEVGQQNRLLSYFAGEFQNLGSLLTGITQRLDRMEGRSEARFDNLDARVTRVEIRLTNLEADVALIKGWLAPPSEDGSGA